VNWKQLGYDSVPLAPGLCPAIRKNLHSITLAVGNETCTYNDAGIGI